MLKHVFKINDYLETVILLLNNLVNSLRGHFFFPKGMQLCMSLFAKDHGKGNLINAIALSQTK